MVLVWFDGLTCFVNVAVASYVVYALVDFLGLDGYYWLVLGVAGVLL